MKAFEKRVRWEFKVASHGYGRNVKEALTDATERLLREIEMDFSDSDLEAIENHETIDIVETEVEDE